MDKIRLFIGILEGIAISNTYSGNHIISNLVEGKGGQLPTFDDSKVSP